MKDRITIEGRDGAFGAYIARPKALPAPAVVVLHEVFGVNADIRKTCTELAEQGFIAVAPDYSGGRSRASTSASPPSPTGNTAFASIKPMTGTQAPRTLRTPPPSWPNCRRASAELPSSAIASAG
jgi:dienelactone hydrolase